MKKFKEISEEKATEEVGTRQSGPITLSKERKAKLVKVFDSLKVGDTVKIKFKRGGFEKQIPIRKKEVLRTRNRGWTRITFGDGVYLYKDPEEGRVVYAHGRMPSEVMDMIKESLDEAMKPSQVRSAISKVKKGLMRKWKQKGGYENFGQKELSQMKDKFDYNPYGSSDEKQISKMLDGFDNWAMNYDGNMREDINEVQQKEGEAGFSDAQLQKMKKSYSTLKRIDPSSQNYKKLKTKISELDVDRLEQIARAKIRFVSMIAAGEYAKKSGKRLHARDYMESTELEERKLTDAEMDKREKVAKAIEKDNPDMPMGKKMAIATNVAKGVQMENDEYDNEGGMALSQLRTAKSAVEDLMASIKEMDNLPEWVQSKLTKAVDYMDSVRDYMASEEGKEPVDEASAYADARRAFKRDDKRGLASLKRDTDDSATDSDKKAANKNIIMQLRKAADLPNGADVIFPSGTKRVDRRTAQQMLVKFNSLKKSFEKDKFQKSIRSLADVKKMIGR
ncbi:hypothetical protein PQZ07_00340 [bacterium]|nr:hypothetical protein [bacterium]